MGKNDINIDLNANLNVYQNTAQDCIVITKDKLELVLIKTENVLTKKKSWYAPLSTLITSILALSSAEFKEFLMLSASEWKIIFIFLAVISFFLLCIALKNAWNNRKCGNIDDIINQIISVSNKQTSIK